MKETIDIKTPAGYSLEGFPKEVNTDKWANTFNGILGSIYYQNLTNLELHKGDKITIEVIE